MWAVDLSCRHLCACACWISHRCRRNVRSSRVRTHSIPQIENLITPLQARPPNQQDAFPPFLRNYSSVSPGIVGWTAATVQSYCSWTGITCDTNGRITQMYARTAPLRTIYCPLRRFAPFLFAAQGDRSVCATEWMTERYNFISSLV